MINVSDPEAARDLVQIEHAIYDAYQKGREKRLKEAADKVERKAQIRLAGKLDDMMTITATGRASGFPRNVRGTFVRSFVFSTTKRSG